MTKLRKFFLDKAEVQNVVISTEHLEDDLATVRDWLNQRLQENIMKWEQGLRLKEKKFFYEMCLEELIEELPSNHKQETEESK
jgi:macrodomain Ter protein organizer (MatP/YcbG family)